VEWASQGAFGKLGQGSKSTQVRIFPEKKGQQLFLFLFLTFTPFVT